MQQDKQARVPSSSRPARRPGNIFRKQPSFLPFDEERDQSAHNGGQGHNGSDIVGLYTAKGLGVANTQTPGDGLPAIARTNIPNQESPALFDTWSPGGGPTHTPGTNSSEGFYRFPNTNTPGGAPYRGTSGNNAPHGGLHHLPNTEMPRNTMANSFSSQHFSYDDLDEQLEDEFDFSRMSTVHLMQLSGMMQAIPKSLPVTKEPTGRLNNMAANPPLHSLYEDEFMGRASTLPRMPAISAAAAAKPTPAWKAVLNHPVAKTVFGLAIGLAIIYLLSRLIDFKATAAVLEQHLSTPAGILHACIGGVAFALAFTLRGARWKLFLNRISNVSVFKVIRIYWIGVFINFLLPVQGGEVAKSLILKKVAGVPVSQSLPTVAMDKALDLMPVLVIIAIVPLIPGIHMNITLWLVMGLIASILVALMIVVALTWWKREAAIRLINFFLRLLPKGIGAKIEGFAMGFVDSLIEGVKRPKSFIPAAMLTALAILCEGIFAWQEFQAVGLDTIGLGISIFGYTVFTMFSVLPTPPAQVGTNEGAKAIVFTSLLGFSKDSVLAMSLLSHLVGPLVMASFGMASVWSLGLTLSSVLNMKGGQHEEKEAKVTTQAKPAHAEKQVARV